MKTLHMLQMVSVSALISLGAACSKPATDSQADTAKTHQDTNHTAHHAHNDGHHDMSHDHGLLLKSGYAKPSVPGQKVSAAYFTLANPTDHAINVEAVSSDVATQTEFHTMHMDGSNMVMRQLEEVSIPPQGELVLSQGGDHVMLMGLKQSLQAGDKVNLTLALSNGETFTMTVPVKAAVEVSDAETAVHHHEHAGH